jgi:hypothetical protein
MLRPVTRNDVLPAARLEAKKRVWRAASRRYRQGRRDGVEVVLVKLTPERRDALTRWLRLGGHADEVTRSSAAGIIARVIDALDV